MQFFLFSHYFLTVSSLVNLVLDLSYIIRKEQMLGMKRYIKLSFRLKDFGVVPHLQQIISTLLIIPALSR